MNNTLQERVQKMLDGEIKRREIALKWMNEVEEILLSASEHIWGTGDNFGDMPTNTITLIKIDKEGKKKDTCIYFRYVEHRGSNNTEYTGFYDNSETECNTWGKSIEDLHGKEFWYAIQIIIDWIPQVIDMMDKREESRTALLSKIN